MTNEFPAIHSQVHRTSTYGVPYLCGPGVVLLAKPQVDLSGMAEFLRGMDPDFEQYVNDEPLASGTEICKAAGQVCYLSFGPKRTKNAEAKKYFDNILSSGHGSVLEHPAYTFLFYGISRSITHELVRHRVGTAFSQVSQRYVGADRVRFVERPEYQNDQYLHNRFLERINAAKRDYDGLATSLSNLQGGGDALLSGEAKTELRKKVQQCARSLLPNETEAPTVFSGNIRALRHIIEMRASQYAEIEIRNLFYKVYLIMAEIEPVLFADYEPVELSDGTMAVKTPFRKV